MKWILMLLAAALFAGCSTAPKSSDTVALAPGQVPFAVIKEIPNRVHTLQAGMTEAQVFQALGLYDIALSGDATGPLERNVRAYELCPSCTLNLVFDARQRPAKFLSVRLEGQGWKKI